MNSVKITCVDEIRRVNQSHFNFEDWETFCKQLRDLFHADFFGLEGGRLGWRLQYVDGDGETITVRSSIELAEAMQVQSSGILRFNIAQNKPRGWRFMSKVGTVTCDLPEGAVIQLAGIDGKCSDIFKVRIVSSGLACLEILATPGRTVAIRPGIRGAASYVDYHGRFGPFAQFLVVAQVDASAGFTLFNQKTKAYLKVVDGKLVPFHPNHTGCNPKEILVTVSFAEPPPTAAVDPIHIVTPLHEHPLEHSSKATSWRCDSGFGCTSSLPRWRCTCGCDYDLCGSCVHESFGASVPVDRKHRRCKESKKQQQMQQALIEILNLSELVKSEDKSSSSSSEE